MLRVAAGPGLVGLALAGEDGACAVLLSLGVLSDIFDGVLARRWNVSTPALRTWDSRADVAFWACAFGALIVSRPDWLAVLCPAIALFVALEAANHGFSFYRFGREASPHHYLSKAFGLALWLFVGTAFVTGRLQPLFGVAATIGVLSQVEAFLITARLRAWRCDVPSVFTLRP
ncbi:CDP-alcohol phosphatidyltransferase family protein [Brevundimonas sp.]|uniref:CDP-alcohol phosphatidyltransferase family protein n=1 Tax=Brevundimonas sp. TaxID=1871086 RepID=UPI003D0CB750